MRKSISTDKIGLHVPNFHMINIVHSGFEKWILKVLVLVIHTIKLNLHH